MSYETFSVEVGEVDYMGEYQLCHLFNRFSKIATNSAKDIGLWNPEMLNQYGWVVAKQSLHLNQPICQRDIIELSTTVGKNTLVTFPRFYFLNKDQKQIGYCSSIWTLIDITSRRIVSPKKIGLQVPVIEEDNPFDAPLNIDIDIPMQYITTRQVLYSDVDTNQHMNNTRYIQWSLDLIDFHIHKEYYLSDLSIQYRKEIRPLEQVYLYLAHQNNRYIIEGRNQEDEAYFTLEIYFEKR